MVADTLAAFSLTGAWLVGAVAFSFIGIDIAFHGALLAVLLNKV
jgi:hypothetical protein